MNEEFGCHDDRREETGGSVKKPQPSLLSDIGNMAEIPGNQVIDLVERRHRHVYGVGDIFAVKNAAFDIAFRQDGDLFGQLKLLERLDQVEAAGAVGFGHPLKLTLDQYRA